MNAPVLDRARLATGIAAVQARFPLAVAGILPDGTVGHVSGRQPLVLLADKGADLSLLQLSEAEVLLEDALGVPARIVLRSELDGPSSIHLLTALRPL